ncbi:hypothetical protein J2849_000965 [Azospirillum melinis]|nr:hypothetical protein [Azospirillum melinis]
MKRLVHNRLGFSGAEIKKGTLRRPFFFFRLLRHIPIKPFSALGVTDVTRQKKESIQRI